MERFNETRFIGNVGKFVDQKKSIYIAVAINESYKPKDATEWVENTVWIDVVAFGPVCQKIIKSQIKVGDSVLVLGKLASREYEGKRYLQVIAQKIQIIERKKSNGNGNGNEQIPIDNDIPNEDKKEDDLPF